MPTKRLPRYFNAVERTPSTLGTAIEQHFGLSEHVPSDLKVQIVDQLANASSFHPACIPAERCRLEEIWINKLQAELNVKRQSHFSFVYAQGADEEGAD